MMFSARTNWDSVPAPLFALAQEMRAAGKEIIDLTESNPTKCGFLSDPDDLIPRSALQRSINYDPDPKGLFDARQVIARWYCRQGTIVDPSHIVLASSTSEAYSFLLGLLCNSAESIAVPKPSYPLFDYLARLNDVECRHYGLAYDGEWHVDWPSLENVLTAGTKALVLVHPNNPTGSYITTDEAERIVRVSRELGIPLIVDEVFGAYSLGESARRFGSFAGTHGTLTFTLNGISKLGGLPQLKLAWIAVSGPDHLCSEALRRLEIIADTFLSVGTPVQHSLGSLMGNGSPMTGKIKERLVSNVEELRRTFSASLPASLFACEGGWSAVLRLPAIRSDEEWALELLRSQGVLVYPGQLFEFDIPSCIVVSLLPKSQIVSEGIRRIVTAISG
ncbi:MAG: pyridoxal phosphate-dependent aminotransferase [Ignavibacteriales bacterium]|nr:pyridoxal phosphate-dependent aminotransferase [Ignavibacteriales bacterium]